MPVFTEGPRCDARPPYPKESAVAYLDRSARPEADALRSLIEDWLELYPSEEAPDLAARLRSSRDDQHRSAFFELLLHRLVLALGHHVPAVEPKLPHTWKSPDFQVESADGARFYLEGISAQGADLHGVLKRKASRYGALDLPLVVAVASSEDEAGLTRALKELWHGPRGPQRRILSAVLAFGPVDPWRFRESRIRLIRNPWAEIPLPAVDLGDGHRIGELV
ncbi:MAG TPA: hypothetical protein VKP60_18640 [Magnetospirillaceae bacterium]|nr:hypothetical protein [Magnetospirillaceae bacterium]